MPNFPTMAKDDVLLRVKLTAFRVDDLVNLLEGQTTTSGVVNTVKETVVQAKQANLPKPYVKVGLVKEKLVFRIKTEDGHYGEEDIVLVRKYKELEREDSVGPKKKTLLGTTGVFNKKAGDPTLTLDWWNRARGDFVDDALTRALEAWEPAARRLAEAPSLAGYGDATRALSELKRATRALAGRLTVKEDKKVLRGFFSEVADELERVEDGGEQYMRRLNSAREAIKSDMEDVAANPERNIQTLRQSIENRERYETIARNFARIVPAFERSLDWGKPDLERAIETTARNKAVHPEDLPLSDFAREFRDIKQRVAALENVLGELQRVVEELEPVGGGDIDLNDLPEEIDRAKLKRAWTGYQETLATCKDGTRALAGFTEDLAALDRVTDVNVAIGQFLDILSAMVKSRETSKSAMARTRNSGSEYTRLKVEAFPPDPNDSKKKKHEELYERVNGQYFEPTTNLILTEAAKQRRLLAKMKRLAASFLKDRVPELGKSRIKAQMNKAFETAN